MRSRYWPSGCLDIPCSYFSGEQIGQRLFHFVEAGAVGVGLFHRRDQIFEIATEECQMLLRHHAAVAGNDVREIEFIERVERAHPVLRITVVHERHPVDQRVAGRHHFFLRQVNEHVAVGMAAPEQQDLDFAVAHVQRDRPVEGPGRQGRFHRPQFFQVGLGLPQVRFEPRPLCWVGR